MEGHPFLVVAVMLDHRGEVVEAHPFRVVAVMSDHRGEVVEVHPTQEVVEVSPFREEEVEVHPYPAVAEVYSRCPCRAAVVVVVRRIRAGGAGVHSVHHLTLYLLLPMKHFPPTRSLL